MKLVVKFGDDIVMNYGEVSDVCANDYANLIHC